MPTLLDITPSAPLHYKPIQKPQTFRCTSQRSITAKPLLKTMDEKKKSPTELWGSNHSAGWLSYVPSAYIPYLQLTRLYNPAPIMLVYFPHLFGLLYAAITLRTPPLLLLRSAAILFGGSVFFSNAAHVWDDVVDAPLDAQIERTKHRPIPRGAVTQTAACVFMATQAVCALAFFATFPGGWEKSFWTVPSIIGTAYYPFAKRHTRVPQLVLGLVLSWGVVIGALVLGVEAVDGDWSVQAINVPLVAMLLGCTLWTMIYDTLYAHLDLQVDLQLDVGSTAVLFQEYTKHFLWAALALMSASLATVGLAGGLGLGFFVPAVGGSAMSLAFMIANVELEKPKSIGWWFSNGFWYTASAIGGGLILEYLSMPLLV